MVEVFTKPGTNSEWCKAHIIETTGFVPAIYDKGTQANTLHFCNKPSISAAILSTFW